MLIHPWDASHDDTEWRTWLLSRDFGQLTANAPDRGHPVVVPTPFLYDGGDEVVLHLARPNPVWPAVEANPHVTLSTDGDGAYIPTTWRPSATGVPADGVPTSYYTAVQLLCRAEIVDDKAGKAAILERQLAHHQPDGDHGHISPDEGPYHRMLSSIRGLRLVIQDVKAKFKYDDHKPADVRERVSALLEARGDAAAREQQQRRMAQSRH